MAEPDDRYVFRVSVPDAPPGTTVTIGPPQEEIYVAWYLRPLPRWRRWLRRIANRDSRIETNDG